MNGVSKGGGGGGGNFRSDHVYERENNRLAEGLSSKVSQLKHIAIDMRDEARSQTSFLSSLSDDFADSVSLLGRSGKRFKTVVNSGSQNRSTMCYIITGAVVMFLIFYYGSGFFLSRTADST